MNHGEVGQHVQRMVVQLRTARGWSQPELAKRLRAAGFPLHPTSVTRLERGRRNITVDELVALARAFDVPVGDLLGVEVSADVSVRSLLAQRELLRELVVDLQGRSDQVGRRLSELSPTASM